MYYNTRTHVLLNTMPLNGYTEEGTLVQGLDLADAETQKLCGILPVKSDSPTQPANTTEDTTQRNIVVESDGVIITRVWVPIPMFVPQNISPRQIRLWLVEHNISLSTIDAAINSIEDDMLREKTKIEWEFSPYVERHHPMIDTLGSVLGLSAEQIDQAFIEANQL